jgi:hypothetical protein
VQIAEGLPCPAVDLQPNRPASMQASWTNHKRKNIHAFYDKIIFYGNSKSGFNNKNIYKYKVNELLTWI